MAVVERKKGETVLQWEDPPVKTIHRPRKKWWVDVIPQVAQRPGFWACVRIYENGNSARVAARELRNEYRKGSFPEGSWEVRSAEVDGVNKVYVKVT